jgi:hypothetical protein
MQQKLFHLSGIAFVAVVALSIGVGGSTPGTDDPAAEVVSFYNDNEARQFVTSFLFAATVPFLVLFAVGLGRVVSSVWSQVTVAGVILVGSAILATSAIHFALLDAAGNEVTSDAVGALNALEGSTWVAYNAGLGVMMLGAAGVLLSAGVMRWLGWSALVLGIMLFIPFVDFVALLLTLVWIVGTSIVLARSSTEPRNAVAPAAA